MSDYVYKKDNKLHTRFSELLRCTPGQIQSVIEERIGLRERITTDEMDFGSERHEMWKTESLETGFSPKCFSDYKLKSSYVEKEFATEIFPDVVVHSRPDFVSLPDETIMDHKTLAADTLLQGGENAIKYYKNSKQLTFYAFQLSVHNLRIKRGIYSIEIWNRSRDKILGYSYLVRDFSMRDLADIVPFVKDRVAMLISQLKQFEGGNNAEV